jgi:hypothetical protein
MKMNLGDFKEEELDASELINLLDFDDDMWNSITRSIVYQLWT